VFRETPRNAFHVTKDTVRPCENAQTYRIEVTILYCSSDKPGKKFGGAGGVIGRGVRDQVICFNFTQEFAGGGELGNGGGGAASAAAAVPIRPLAFRRLPSRFDRVSAPQRLI
jgi:hypothetical protein